MCIQLSKLYIVLSIIEEYDCLCLQLFHSNSNKTSSYFSNSRRIFIKPHTLCHSHIDNKSSQITVNTFYEFPNIQDFLIDERGNTFAIRKIESKQISTKPTRCLTMLLIERMTLNSDFIPTHTHTPKPRKNNDRWLWGVHKYKLTDCFLLSTIFSASFGGAFFDFHFIVQPTKCVFVCVL